MKGDKMTKRLSFGNMVRRRVSDITNSLPQPKSPVLLDKMPTDAASTIDHLLKEKMALVQHILEKNKIIELSGIEIQNLRSFLQKMQQQNWSLAQSNSHMLAELNLRKERLKALEHEVACKDALLKTKTFELKGSDKEPGCDEGAKPCNAIRRLHPVRSLSLGSSTVSQQQAKKEAVGSKRRCLRRQSASWGIQNESLFEIDEAKFSDSSMPSNTPINEGSSTENGVIEFDGEVEESGRTSINGRPLRKAAVKVQSYKEKPINIKMRR